MKRRRLYALLFLLLGAILNVAVAWGCAAWTRPAPNNPGYGFSAVGEGEHERLWTVARLRIPGSTLIISRRYAHSARHHSGTYITTAAHPEEIVPYWANVEQPLPGGAKEEWRHLEARGWPFRSLLLETRNLTDEDWMQKVTLHHLLRTPLSPHVWGGWEVSRHLPLRPILPGFLCNTVLYAVLLWAPFFLYRNRRSQRRRRRGHCVKCGYDLRDDLDTGCPECGWNRTE